MFNVGVSMCSKKAEPMTKPELNEIHFLRGAASLMVCLFHLSLGNSALFPSSHWIKQAFLSGYVGVEVFFILSGYVICIAFPKTEGAGNTTRFLLKRFTRIEPPYFVSILLVIVLNTFSHLITGVPNPINYADLVRHLVYLNNFYPGTYVNIVYWTLGIEFQYYLLIALLFPLIRRSAIHLFATLGIFFILSCLPYPRHVAIVLPYLGYFGLGIVLSFYKQKHIGRPLAIAGSVMFLLQLFFLASFKGLAGGIVVSSILLFWRYATNIIKFFSMISFSLYLTHVPIGGKVINLGLRYVETPLARYLLLLVSVVISIAFAFAFYKLVEQPSLKLAKKIHYKVPILSSSEEKVKVPAKAPAHVVTEPIFS
ncbi:MAG: acyltransferase [Chitinophagaceae bacterium]|nr:MAG: acyltransferase [Chitinophagaceae bacterium]